MFRQERDALKAIDTDVLDKLIEQSIDEKCPSSLRILRLESCGPYAASQFRAFGKALVEYGSAKAAKKLAETESRALRAGSDLAYAIRQMKGRVETEEREEQFFYVDDLIMTPNDLSEQLTVRVTYRWRSTIENKWQYGSIVFTHDVDLRPHYTISPPKRKPSARKLKEDRQEELYRKWECLMRLGLYSVREFFREGGDAAVIPKTFQAKVDSHTRELNNFSCRFWPVGS